MNKDLITGLAMRRGLMRGRVSVSYTFHDWIQCDETTNTSYIKTGLIPNRSNDWTFEGSFARTALIPSDYKFRCVFTRFVSGTYSSNYSVQYKAKNQTTIAFNYNSRGNCENYAGGVSTSIDIGVWHKFKLTSDPEVSYGGKCTIDENSAVYNDGSIPNSDVTTELTLLRGYPCRLGRFKVYIQGNLVADMIPATRDTDNAVGMYDVVRNKFYQPTGSSPFICGEGFTNF